MRSRSARGSVFGYRDGLWVADWTSSPRDTRHGTLYKEFVGGESESSEQQQTAVCVETAQDEES